MNFFKDDIKNCNVCKKINKPYNITCESCGFDLDFTYVYNQWGIPVLTARNN